MGSRELVMLSRTNRGFHDILSSRSAANFWKAARGSIEGFPERPAWLHEMTYARLAFDTFCTVRIAVTSRYIRGNDSDIRLVLLEETSVSCRVESAGSPVYRLQEEYVRFLLLA